MDQTLTPTTRLRKTTAVLLAGRLVSAVSTLVLLAVFSRHGGLRELGIGSLGVVIGSSLAALAEAGTNSLLTREVSRSRLTAATYLTTVLTLRMVLVPTCLLLSWPVCELAFGADGSLILLFGAGFVIQQFGELVRSLFLALGHPEITAGHMIVENVAWAGSMVAILALGGDLYAASWAGIVVMVASAIAGGLLAVVFGVRLTRISRGDLTRVTRLSLPFAAYSLVAVAAFRMDTVLVSLLVPSGIAAAGAYFSASRLISSAEYLPDALSRAALPDLSRHAVAARDQAHKLLRLASEDLLNLSVPIPFALVTVGWGLLPLFFGSALEPYSWILIALGIGVPARFLVLLYGMSLTSADAQGRRVAVTLVAVVAGQSINVLLLPVIGVPAAVVASLTTTTLLLTQYLRFIGKSFGTPLVAASILRPVVRSIIPAVPALVCAALLPGKPSWQCVVGLSVYGSVYLTLLLGPSAIQRLFSPARAQAGSNTSRP